MNGGLYIDGGSSLRLVAVALLLLAGATARAQPAATPDARQEAAALAELEAARALVAEVAVTVALAPRVVAKAPTTATLSLATRPDGAELVVDGKAAGRWYKRWYLWTIAAVVVVAATGAGVGGYFATRPHYDATITF